MDVLEEKANGGPSMEIDEVVSVRDRKSCLLDYWLCLKMSTLACPIDEAFAAKHMPDLGHDVKDFKVFTWRLNNWKKLDKKLTSSDFECGGHKWYVTLCPHLHWTNVRQSGVYYSSHLAIPMLHQMTRCLCTSIMPSRRKRPKAGMHVHSLHWLSPTFMTLPFSLSAVSLD
jgi:hypothetical protein